MIIKEAIAKSIKDLKEHEIMEPESSAVLLLADVLVKERSYIYAHTDDELTKSQLDKFQNYIKRRLEHEPVWYIVGEVEFYRRKFKINNNVLTPRPETEFLVKEVLKAISNISHYAEATRDKQFPITNVIELGTGSGAIAVTLAKELGFDRGFFSVIPATAGIQNPKRERLDSHCDGNDKGGSSCFVRTIIATDISAKALDVAKKNAKIHGAEKDIEFLEGDLLEPITNKEYQITNTIIVANLPYIPNEDMDSLQFDVLHHEPRIALDGGIGGLEIYERLLNQMKELGFSGMAFFEIGIDQGKLITKIIQKYFPNAGVEVKKDLAGIDRIVIINFQ